MLGWGGWGGGWCYLGIGLEGMVDHQKGYQYLDQSEPVLLPALYQRLGYQYPCMSLPFFTQIRLTKYEVRMVGDIYWVVFMQLIQLIGL